MYKRLALGVYGTNCYIAVDDNTKFAAVIDPAGDFDQLKTYIENNNLLVKYIILTHGHGDHTGAVIKLKKYSNAPVCINEGDLHMISNSDIKNFFTTGSIGLGIKADIMLEDGSTLELGDSELNIIHTPGHTQGSVCIIFGNELFAGDTLFAGSIGRTDFPGGSYEQIISSIKNKLLCLDSNLAVHPGHGASTLLSTEKKSNPFLKV